MPAGEFHLSDKQLLMAVDGELSASDAALVESHIAACWSCRTRKQEIEAAIGEFVRAHRREFDVQIPSADGPRALLKARLAEKAANERILWKSSPLQTAKFLSVVLSAACALIAATYFISRAWTGTTANSVVTFSTPNPNLTPGAVVLANRDEVCSGSSSNDRPVPVSLRRRVFGEYGIDTANPEAYEVDYLSTPALGGADDIHNLWPQSNRSVMWNAHVKNALEERLRTLVCNGNLDLVTAQHDMATNWIEAYKKYFHTDRPLASYR
jgi:hypothetical protein